MKHILYKYIACIWVAMVTASCSEIADDERFVEVQLSQTSDSQRHVLLEDFTGQSCVNCPEAAEVIHELQSLYGDDIVVAVGIYSGPFGKPKGSTAVSLVTDLGETYWDHWFNSNTSQPIGLINRQTSLGKDDWKKAVMEALSAKTSMKIEINSQNYEEASREYHLTVQVTDSTLAEGNLQVWLIENGFVGSQMLNNGSSTPKRDYVHNHVFRASMNGDWGETITLGSADGTSRSYSIVLDEKWNAANMEVVAFVYTNQGVEQVVKYPLLNVD